LSRGHTWRQLARATRDRARESRVPMTAPTEQSPRRSPCAARHTPLGCSLAALNAAYDTTVRWQQQWMKSHQVQPPEVRCGTGWVVASLLSEAGATAAR